MLELTDLLVQSADGEIKKTAEKTRSAAFWDK
jgi:hypothetical protein